MSDAKNVQLISANDLVEVKPTPDVNLPDIVAEKAFQPKGGEPYMLLYCKPKQKYDGPCPLCGCCGKEFKSNGFLTQPRHVHDIPVGIITVDLYLRVPRYICRDCGGIFTHPFDSVVERRQCTKRLVEKIRRDCFSRPFSEIAAETGYTIPTISNIFDEYIAELDATRPPIVAPEVLGIDEKHIVHQMRAIFVDNKTGLLLEMLPSNKSHEIIKTIENMVNYDSGYGFNHLRAKALYRHRSGARHIYRLDTSKRPIYDTSTHMTTTFTPGFLFSPGKIIGYETVSSIKVEEQPTTKRRLSVLEYVDNDALYYDFPDFDETE